MFNFDNKKKLAFAITLYCSLILLIIIIAQYDKISAIVNSVLSALSPIIIGFALAYLLNPILKFYEKTVLARIKNKLILRALGMALTYISFLGFITAFVMLISPRITNSISDLIGQLDTYKDTTIKLVNSVLGFLAEIEIISEQIDAAATLAFIGERFASGEEIAKTVLNYITSNYKLILNVPLNTLIGLFISIYTLSTKEKLSAQFKKFSAAVLSKNANEAVAMRIKRTHSTFGGYFTGVLLDAIFIGFASFILMLIFKVPYASLISVVLSITNVIPFFGPILGTIPCALLVFIADPPKVIVFVILIIVLQQIDGNIIAPKILGNSTGMSSLGVIIAITVMGACFGFLGMFIGVPVFAAIIALIRDLIEERLKEKNLSIRTIDYYPKDAIVVPTEKTHFTLWGRIAGAVRALFAKIGKKKKK